MSYLWIILQAKGSVQFLSRKALQVAAKAPLPRQTSIFIVNWPTFLFFSFIYAYYYLYIFYLHQSWKEAIICLGTETGITLRGHWNIMRGHLINNRMYNNRKLIMCKNCRYFPTKIDALKGNLIVVRQNKVIWKCESCSQVNSYEQTGSIMLPQTSLVKINQKNVLHQASPYCAHWIIVVDCTNVFWDKIVYCPPFDRKGLQYRLTKDLSELKTHQELSSESKWLGLYLGKKAAINKFGVSKLHKNKRAIRQDEYIIYCIEMYLRNLIGNKESVVWNCHVKLIDCNVVYSFQLSEVVADNNQQLQQLLQIYALLTCKQLPAWLLEVFGNVIKKHTIREPQQRMYQSALLISSQLQKENYQIGILKQFIGEAYRENQEKKFIINRINLSNTESILYPLSEAYCCRSLRLKTFKELCQIQQSKSGQQIKVYFQYESQSTISIYHASIKETKLLQSLFSRSRNVSIEEQSKLSITVRQMISSKSIVAVQRLIKLYGRIRQNNESIIIMFTFNWKQIEAEFIQSFEDEPNHDRPFFDNCIPNQHFRQQMTNPFLVEGAANRLSTPFTSIASLIRKSDEHDIYI